MKYQAQFRYRILGFTQPEDGDVVATVDVEAETPTGVIHKVRAAMQWLVNCVPPVEVVRTFTEREDTQCSAYGQGNIRCAKTRHRDEHRFVKGPTRDELIQALADVLATLRRVEGRIWLNDDPKVDAAHKLLTLVRS